MIEIWAYSLVAVFIVSLISFVGTLALALSPKIQSVLLMLMVAFAIGAMLGDTFLHLLPDAVSENGFTLSLSLAIIAGMMLFFVLEKLIHWTHCHLPGEHTHPRPYAWMNLIGDGVHNFIDGTLIAGSFMISVPLGITTSIAVVAHEIPQEMGDYAVLLHGGFSKFRASFYNFLTALTAVLGAVAALLVGNSLPFLAWTIVPITAGGFIYIAAVDLIPEIHKETKPLISLLQFISISAGIGVMVALLQLG